MNLKYYLTLICSCALLAGCTTPKTSSSEGGAQYVVMMDFTQFYSMGPAQPGGPDLSLRNGEQVTLLKKGWGYSQVRLQDDRIGYVDSASIAPAPSAPKPSSESVASKKRRKNEAAYTGEQVNDTPLPDLPPPNLNIAPEDLPEAGPLPSATPAKPSFRY